MTKVEGIINQLEKSASIFGERVDTYNIDSTSIPYDARKALLKEYFINKAEEPKTKWSTALPVGALVGGGLAALASGGGSNKIMAAGATIGTLLSAVLKKADDIKIQEAQDHLANYGYNEPIKDEDMSNYIINEISRKARNNKTQEVLRQYKEDVKHNELLSALRNKQRNYDAERVY